VVAVIVLMLGRRRIAAPLIGLSLAWGLFWSLPASSLWAGGRLEHLYPYTAAEDLPGAQAIVVLGGNTAGGRLNWVQRYEREKTLTRTDSAAILYKADR